MHKKSSLDKVSQIILISNSYISHKKNLTKVKGLVDHSTTKRNIDINDYLHRKNMYRQVRKSLKERILGSQNQKIVGRLSQISDRRRNNSRLSSRSSQGGMSRVLSGQVTEYKARRSFMKSREVQQQNSRMKQRIKNAHFKNGLSPKNYQNSKKQNRSYKKVHSRFSDRSKNQMKQILQGLNYDHKKIPFLPALPSHRYSKL